jgi:diaminopimelate decarboxylase
VIGAARQRLTAVAKASLGPLAARRHPTRIDLPLSRWDLSIGPNATLWSGNVDLHALARAEGTPLHVVRADRLAENAERALGAAPHGTSGLDVFYSYKTNPVPAVLQRLHRCGIGAEVISPYELWLALRLGVPADRIIYNGPAKSPESIAVAIDSGVLLINANSAPEASVIAEVAHDRGRTANLGIRVNLPGMWGGQFGIRSDSAEVLDTVRRSVADPGVELRALHFHRGLTIRDLATMDAYLAGILQFCDALRSRTGWHPELLDIGGSLGCATVAPIPARQLRLNRALGTDLLAPDPRQTVDLADAAHHAVGVVTDHFDRLGLPPPRLVIEPGRALTGDTQILLTTVLDVKHDGALAHAVLDAGINVAEPVPNEYHQLFSVSTPGSPATTAYRLVGPICTPADVLYNNWRLPPLEPGHVLAIMDSGAYFVPFSTTFSFPKPAVVLQDGDRITTGRRRETFDDLVALDALDDPDRPG